MKTEKCNNLNKPLVTAVITIHNRINLVKKAINSVKKQTYSNLELIVVDDASESSAKEELTKLAKEKNFSIFILKKMILKVEITPEI